MSHPVKFLTFAGNPKVSRQGCRLDFENGSQQILDDLILVLLAGVLDLGDLGVRLLIRIFLGLLVALCVLQSSKVARRQ